MPKFHLFHDWTQWSEPELKVFRRRFSDPSMKEVEFNRHEQSRKCKICNLQQRREVKKIYEAGADLCD